jgi:DNA-binding MarR family transcriptional regulator
MALRTPVRRADPAASQWDWVDVNLTLLADRLPGLDVSGSHVTARIFRLREILLKALDRAHAQFGLKPRMFLVLAALYRSGRPYSLSPANLMRYLMWTSGGLSQLLDRMEKAGLIRRQADPNDGRGVLVTLSLEGERVIVDVLELHCRTELRLIAGLSKTEHSTLVNLLRKLLIAVEGPQTFPAAAQSRLRMKSVR